MTVTPFSEAQSFRPTVFDTEEWLDAWTRATIERRRIIDPGRAPRYLLEDSPFWHGLENDTGSGVVWDRPVLTIGTIYSVYGPAYLTGDEQAVAALVDGALEQARDLGAAGLLVLNLPPEPARQWAAVRPPDVFARLDTAYYKNPGSGPDPVLGEVKTKKRTDWRRRWRRATEKGVKLVEETGPEAVAQIDRLLELTNGSAVKHGWPALYDHATLEAVLSTPYASLVRAEWEDQTIGAAVALEHDRKLYLWCAGTDATVYSEVSPYPFMLYELLAQGVDRGWDIIEFGRGNDTFKKEHGFSGIHLWGLWYATDPGDVEIYRPRLTAVHEGLLTVAGYEGLAQRP
ncbi:GNAT family N-acetyltransferase [Micromonospora sp. NPDC051196]|uniref:GNAT family N-acetyltransferase n=1 Tax=Micromonospora sp. NPDC051196 TaxID=3155281 RepID=UPI00342404F9